MDDLDEKSENLSLSVIIPNENSVNESLLSLINGSEAHQLDLKFESYFEDRNECEPKEEANIFDHIIDAFTVKRRKALIDQSTEEDHLISYHDSQTRILGFLFILASCLIHICTILLVCTIPYWISIGPVIHTPDQWIPKPPKALRPHLALLFKNGHLELFEQQGLRLNHSWNFKIPAVQDDTGYLVYAQLGTITILYSNGRKNAIFLKHDGHNFKHGTILNSKVPDHHFYNPRSVQVGHHFITFGGQWKLETATGGNHDMYFCIDHQYNHPYIQPTAYVKRSSMIWNSQKEVYYPGPDLPDLSLLRGCPIALNRSHFLILYSNKTGTDYCLNSWMYSFEQHVWYNYRNCLLNLSLPYPSYEYEFELQCSSYFGKMGSVYEGKGAEHTQQSFNVFIVIKGIQCQDKIDHESGGNIDILRFALINQQEMVWIDGTIFEVNNDFHFDDAYEVYRSQGMIYIITNPNGLDQNKTSLKIYQLHNHTIQHVQDVPVKPYNAEPHFNFIGSGAKDFIAVPALF